MAVTLGLQAAAAWPARRQEKGEFVVVETWEASAMPQNDVYMVCKVPVGVSVSGGSVGYDALGANTKVKLGLYSNATGTAVDDDCFVVSTATTSAGITNFNGSISTSWRNDGSADYYVGYLQDDSGTATGTIRVTVRMTAESTDQT
jgi:hypothetical protein